MGFWQVVLVLARRWYITVSALVAAVTVTVVSYDTLPVQFESGSVMAVTTSPVGKSEGVTSPRVTTLTNPLLQFDQSVNLSASILIQELNSPAMMEALGAPAGGTTTYAVGDGNTNAELLQSGPFIFVQVSARTPETAQGLTEAVNATASRILAQRQADLNAPAATYLRITEIVPPTAGRELTRSPTRAVAASGILTALACLAAALGFERLAVRRRRTSIPRARPLDVGA